MFPVDILPVAPGGVGDWTCYLFGTKRALECHQREVSGRWKWGIHHQRPPVVKHDQLRNSLPCVIAWGYADVYGIWQDGKWRRDFWGNWIIPFIPPFSSPWFCHAILVLPRQQHCHVSAKPTQHPFFSVTSGWHRIWIRDIKITYN